MASRFAGLALVLSVSACSKSSSPAATATPAPGSAAPAKAPAAAPPADLCGTAASVRRGRTLAQAQVDAGKPVEALELLEGYDCSLSATEQSPELQSEIAWLISDRAFARYKAGDPEGCYATAAAHTRPYSGNIADQFAEGSAVMKAITHNAKLCHAAAVKKRGSFIAATPCKLGKEGVAIPAALLEHGDTAACLVFGSRGKVDDIHTCRDVELVRLNGGKTTRQTLQVPEEGNLADGGVCCNIVSTGFAKRPSGWAALVTSEGKNCDGGTASSAEEHVYELSGTTLTLAHRLDASYH